MDVMLEILQKIIEENGPQPATRLARLAMEETEFYSRREVMSAIWKYVDEQKLRFDGNYNIALVSRARA